MSYSQNDGLRTISQDGTVPETRMKDARAASDWVLRLTTNDTMRAFKRARVNGLVDGNPPYKASKLKEAGRGDACNVNWGNGRSYLESGSGSFYDLSSEAPSAITVRTAAGNPEQRELWSSLISAEVDKVIKSDTVWDYQMQLSQWNMVLHGCGPMFFEDANAIFPVAVICGDLKVPERTRSDTTYWDGCCLIRDYYPPQLYEFIADASAATAIGWNVAYTRTVIQNAMQIQAQQGLTLSWEFYQQQCKNNSFTYYDDTKVSRLAHVFWEEFDGRITHGIVEANNSTDKAIEYLFLSVGRYANWQEAVHPMYYDHGNGGFHHSVTGLGVKMYSAMEYENRLTCNLADKAFAPKILFSPTSTEMQQKFSLIRMGDFGVMPANFKVEQAAVAGVMGDGIAMRSELTQIMQSTLSNYRQGVPTQKSGNPVTKFEKQMEAAMEAALSMPQYNRYYKQLDMLYSEVYRRMANPNTTDKTAKDLQDKLRQQGVPAKALVMIEYVGATRVVGQGSGFMRKQAIDAVGAVVGSLPEDGRNNWLNDKIAAEAGQSAVARYNPQRQSTMATDQQAEALQWVATMKVGIPFVTTSSQNPVTYAATFLSSAVQGINSLKQGGDPHQVLAYLQIVGPATAACLSRFGQDPTRAQVHEKLMQQWKQLATLTDKLARSMESRAKALQQQEQKTSQAMTDEQIAQQKAQNDIQIKNVKTQAQLQQSQEKHNLKTAQTIQSMKLKDATTAHDIHLANLQAEHEAKRLDEQPATAE